MTVLVSVPAIRASAAQFVSLFRVVYVVAVPVDPTRLDRLETEKLQPAIFRGSGGLALSGSVPTPLMVWWAAGFTLQTLLYAVRTFRRRAL